MNVKREKELLLVLMETTVEAVIKTQLNSHSAGKINFLFDLYYYLKIEINLLLWFHFIENFDCLRLAIFMTMNLKHLYWRH